MLSEPALALTDLVLGAVTLLLAGRLRSAQSAAAAAAGPPIHPAWVATFTWTGLAAIAGFVHHGFVTFADGISGVSFAVVSSMVVVAVSYLLAATVFEVLGPGRRRVFWVLRVASLAFYVVLAANGRAGAGSILMAEGVTMALILGLWLQGLQAGRPRAPRVIVAFVVSALAALAQALPSSTRLAGLDPISIYHLAQIPGIVLLYSAIAPGERRAVDRVDAMAGVTGAG